jgi:hypothetical protein
MNTATGECRSCTGKVKRKWLWFSQLDPVSLPALYPDSVRVRVANDDSLAHVLDYEMVGVSADGDSANLMVMINGQPAGTGARLAHLPGDTAEIHSRSSSRRPAVNSPSSSADAGTSSLRRWCPPLVLGPAGARSARTWSTEALLVRSNPFRSPGHHRPRAAGRGERHNVAGALVRQLVKGRVEAGEHTLAWDGLTEAGDRAPSGVYFIRLEAEHTRRSAKVVRLR